MKTSETPVSSGGRGWTPSGQDCAGSMLGIAGEGPCSTCVTSCYRQIEVICRNILSCPFASSGEGFEKRSLSLLQWLVLHIGSVHVRASHDFSAVRTPLSGATFRGHSKRGLSKSATNKVFVQGLLNFC